MSKLNENKIENLVGTVVSAELIKTDTGDYIKLYFDDGSDVEIKAFYHLLEVSPRTGTKVEIDG